MMFEQIACRIEIRGRADLAPGTVPACRARTEVTILKTPQIVELLALPDFLDRVLTHIPEHILMK